MRTPDAESIVRFAVKMFYPTITILLLIGLGALTYVDYVQRSACRARGGTTVQVGVAVVDWECLVMVHK